MFAGDLPGGDTLYTVEARIRFFWRGHETVTCPSRQVMCVVVFALVTLGTLRVRVDFQVTIDPDMRPCDANYETERVSVKVYILILRVTQHAIQRRTRARHRVVDQPTCRRCVRLSHAWFVAKYTAA